jgi:signal transduction histidine kinase
MPNHMKPSHGSPSSRPRWRIATLVARSTPPSEVFAAVAEEMARCLGTTDAEVFRYDPDGAAVVVAAYIAPGARGLTVNERLTLEGDSVAARVLRTGRPARMDSYEHETADGTIADRTRELGPRSRAGAPIVVDAHVWGVALVGTSGLEPLPSDIEGRIAEFADLVATAIANTATREELLASRARIVAAADEARRRIERNLHDGAQQRLVALGLELRAAEAWVPDEQQPLKERIAGLVTIVTGVSAEVQEISRGLHPAILSRGGLAPALRTLARCTIPVDLDLHVDQRLPDTVEVGAYYIVAEALTNAAKHARASLVEVCAEATNSHLRLEIRDDGICGAAPGKGSGLTGLVDRVEALGGTITIQSQPGSGTSLLVGIPIESD